MRHPPSFTSLPPVEQKTFLHQSHFHRSINLSLLKTTMQRHTGSTAPLFFFPSVQIRNKHHTLVYIHAGRKQYSRQKKKKVLIWLQKLLNLTSNIFMAFYFLLWSTVTQVIMVIRSFQKWLGLHVKWPDCWSFNRLLIVEIWAELVTLYKQN